MAETIGNLDDDDLDDTIDHPSPDELNLFCIDDPKLIEELDRRMADESPGVPWTKIREELW
jgi:hypothetical protein